MKTSEGQMRAIVPTDEQIVRCHELIRIDPVIQSLTAQLTYIYSMSNLQIIISNDGEVTFARACETNPSPEQLQLEKWREERIELLKSRYLE